MTCTNQIMTCSSACGSYLYVKGHFQVFAPLLHSSALHSATYVLPPCVQRSSFFCKPSFPAFSCPVASSNSLSPLSLLTLSISSFPVAIGRPDTCSNVQILLFTLSVLLPLILSLSLYGLLHRSLAFSMPLTLSLFPFFRLPLSLSLALSTCSSHALLSAHAISSIQPGCSIDEGSIIEQYKFAWQ